MSAEPSDGKATGWRRGAWSLVVVGGLLIVAGGTVPLIVRGAVGDNWPGLLGAVLVAAGTVLLTVIVARQTFNDSERKRIGGAVAGRADTINALAASLVHGIDSPSNGVTAEGQLVAIRTTLATLALEAKSLRSDVGLPAQSALVEQIVHTEDENRKIAAWMAFGPLSPGTTDDQGAGAVARLQAVTFAEPVKRSAKCPKCQEDIGVRLQPGRPKIYATCFRCNVTLIVTMPDGDVELGNSLSVVVCAAALRRGKRFLVTCPSCEQDFHTIKKLSDGAYVAVCAKDHLILRLEADKAASAG